jgi:uncharacterized protein YfaP (DUF2135 family)
MTPHLNFLLRLAAMLPLGLAATAQAQITLEAPRGGWRTGPHDNEFVQDVHYPANRVSLREGTGLAAQIRGQIAHHPKGQPATLVVNGTPMPLELAEDGSFARPYAFAAGSNSVEVRSADGRQRKRVQMLDMGDGVRPRLRVLLSWDSPGTDLDLHVISPSGGHCFYANRVVAGMGALDVDVTTGYGPEIFAATRPERGIWHVYVNYFGGGGPAVTTAQITIIDQEGTPAETRRLVRVPLHASGDLQHVASFAVP